MLSARALSRSLLRQAHFAKATGAKCFGGAGAGEGQ